MGRHSCCNQQKVKRGLWSPEEDGKLINFISSHGYGCWSDVPEKAGLQRCGKSCRLRWINYLRPDIRRGRFSPQEEKLIINLHQAVGNRWAHIASHLPGRTDNEIKNYWNSWIKKKIFKKCAVTSGSSSPPTTTSISISPTANNPNTTTTDPDNGETNHPNTTSNNNDNGETKHPPPNYATNNTVNHNHHSNSLVLHNIQENNGAIPTKPLLQQYVRHNMTHLPTSSCFSAPDLFMLDDGGNNAAQIVNDIDQETNIHVVDNTNEFGNNSCWDFDQHRLVQEIPASSSLTQMPACDDKSTSACAAAADTLFGSNDYSNPQPPLMMQQICTSGDIFEEQVDPINGWANEQEQLFPAISCFPFWTDIHVDKSNHHYYYFDTTEIQGKMDFSAFGS